MDDDVETELACPVCGTAMESRTLGDGHLTSCPSGHGIFLRRADLGALIESESDWHRHHGQQTMPMPRITADMTAPPVSKPPARAWVESLFT